MHFFSTHGVSMPKTDAIKSVKFVVIIDEFVKNTL